MQWLRTATPWVFLAVVLASGLLLVWTTPPFQMADEQTHLYRADILTFGPAGLGERTVEGRRYVTGRIHVGIIDAATAFDRLRFHPEQKVGAADYTAAANVRLDARSVDVPPGQALNPAFYLPAAAAVAWGRHFGWTVLHTLYLARVLGLLTCAGLGFAALSIARQARLPIFAVLTLPMSVALFAAVSQDGPLVATAALGVALMSRAMGEDRPLSRGETILIGLCIGAIAVAKLPYAILAVLILLAPTEDRRLRAAAGALALAIPLAWNGWMTLGGWVPPPVPGMTTDTGAQVRFVLQHPDLLGALTAETFSIYGRHYAQEFVGTLGWLDTVLSPDFYPAAWIVLAFAVLASAAVGVSGGWRYVRWAVLPLVLLGVVGVFASLYLGWSSVGAPRIEGVQGRYLLPLALALPLALEGPRPLLSGDRLRTGAQALVSAAVLAFAWVGLVVTQLAVIHRYYLG
jgi:hypothetical protein